VLSYLNLLAVFANTTTANEFQIPSGEISRDESVQWIDGYGGKDYEKESISM